MSACAAPCCVYAARSLYIECIGPGGIIEWDVKGEKITKEW